MTSRDNRGSGDPFDGHGDYQHFGMPRAKLRLGVLVFGSVLIAAVIGGMFLY